MQHIHSYNPNVQILVATQKLRTTLPNPVDHGLLGYMSPHAQVKSTTRYITHRHRLTLI